MPCGRPAGAERLIVDAAVEMAERGHTVDVYTAFHDPSRCFEETVGGPFAVRVYGGWFPRHILGRMYALCAYIRCIIVALHLAWLCWRRDQQYDVVIVDQVSVVVPVLRALTATRVLFYCHFPDLLLARRGGTLRAAYRTPLDWVEEQTTGMAELVLVNSAFTQGVFAQTFARLAAAGVRPVVLHPAVAVPSAAALAAARTGWAAALPADAAAFVGGGPTFLSINRFERKKGIGLAIRALACLHEQQAQAERQGGAAVRGMAQHARREGAAGGAHGAHCRLVVAGGYDARLPENVEHLRELRALAEELGVASSVHFLPSFSDAQRAELLAAAVAVLYTPQNEHFGIVPLEAMAAGRPVVACDSGGPRESVTDGKAGFLCEPRPAAWAAAMERLLAPGVADRMGNVARSHVKARFSRAAFGDRLHRLVLDLAAAPRGGGSRVRLLKKQQ
eukprot:scaffold8.g1385.t1